MRGRTGGELEHHVVSLERRVREIQGEAANAAQALLALSGSERRSIRQPDLEREFRRLRGEVERLEREAELLDPLSTRAEVDRHLEAIERQLRDVLAEREVWMKESLLGRRRRAEDVKVVTRLRDEQERLTAELIRCANAMRRHSSSDSEPSMRRVWKVLRLSGT
jgi:hypothetical protein